MNLASTPFTLNQHPLQTTFDHDKAVTLAVGPHLESRNLETASPKTSLLAQCLPIISQEGYHAPSLEQYRDTVNVQVNQDLQDIQNRFTASIDDLTIKFEGHFRSLTNVEEPLQRPFIAETLNVQVKPIPENAEGHQGVQEVLLRNQIEGFRKLRGENERALCRLWEEWEDVQFELIGLAAEVFGQESMTFAQTRDEDMKPGQKEKLQKVLERVPGSHGQMYNLRESLEGDLQRFEASMNQISSRTKKTMTEMQQQYTIQKNKLFKGLHQHIEMLAAL
ncbi:hypothetical protein A1O3_09694 [Capronia epimyces CBS 606.96]|uniref:Uncharacterized protein n=1 Tax=Capronia epimyces CBS 606.96 TaxID=1182542 RepID=W9XB84_9EURO|nr:uncharacterized protein A1O3_09694 [Capronia epimyces CBS 606.96]EXJ77468.1 hypothetical protein A1O3_09694 [Capronia epimyces CBS 606.96]